MCWLSRWEALQDQHEAELARVRPAENAADATCDLAAPKRPAVPADLDASQRSRSELRCPGFPSAREQAQQGEPAHEERESGRERNLGKLVGERRNGGGRLGFNQQKL
jgi:hypothetical protein